MLNIKNLLSSDEGKIFIVGILLFIAYLLGTIIMYFICVEDANNLLVMGITNFFFGRAAGISYGYTAEFSDILILSVNILVEFIMVMIIYPLFVLSWNKSFSIASLKNFFTSVEKQKIKYKTFFNKYGKYGLFLFVWFPFWMTGPVIGSIIGFLIGIKHYTTMLIVLSGTSLAIVAWTYFLKEIMDLLKQLNANATYIILGLFILIAIILKLLRSRKK